MKANRGQDITRLCYNSKEMRQEQASNQNDLSDYGNIIMCENHPSPLTSPRTICQQFMYFI